MTYLYIFLGAGLGASLRHAISLAASSQSFLGFPTKTIYANFLGSFLAAGAYFILKNYNFSPTVNALALIGFCGGLTTFSAYIIEMQQLLEDKNYSSLAYYFLIQNFMALVLFLTTYLLLTNLVGGNRGG